MQSKKGYGVVCLLFYAKSFAFSFRSSNDEPDGLLRDFKSFTAKKIIEAVETNPQESRKDYLLWFFQRAVKNKTNGSKYQFWQHHNQPIELWTDEIIKQKIDYIHNNPVESGLVTDSTHWKYSSARNFQDDHTVLEIDSTGFLG